MGVQPWMFPRWKAPPKAVLSWPRQGRPILCPIPRCPGIGALAGPWISGRGQPAVNGPRTRKMVQLSKGRTEHGFVGTNGPVQEGPWDGTAAAAILPTAPG